MAKQQILIVDDNPNMSSLLSEMLEIFDFSSQRAGNGQEALDILTKEKFSMVITDLRMPEMSGSELLRNIKQNYPDLPVVVISGYSLAEEEDTLMADMADGFINKPFKMVHIEKLLQRFFKASF
ncbi:MAG: response regulator [candidate division Zixibacteria bacterium]|jgi:CheY-like chemotaxis protein|nr:response regulator [candidate division Zixibacteria bacterium]